MVLAYSYRIKDSSSKCVLNHMSRSVNTVWNYCNETSYLAIKRDHKWISEFELNNLTSGIIKELGIRSSTIQSINRKYVQNRRQFKKVKLRWRTKKSLGWIPFKSKGLIVKSGSVTYYGHTFRFWQSRPIEGIIKEGCFSQDARGRWYVNFQCEVDIKPNISQAKIGVDLGLKTQVTCSDGIKYIRENLTKKYEDRLAKAQRTGKKKQILNIHAKIKNSRKDWNHKTSTDIIRRYCLIAVGNVSSSKLAKTKFAKSVYDSSWYQLKQQLRYKSIRNGVTCKEVNEAFSTVTCSACLEKTGPSGLSNLGVRGWSCSNCGATHDRDVNAACNILRLGCQTPIKGDSEVKSRHQGSA